MPTPSTTRLTDRIIRWGKERDDIRAVFLVGSQARQDHPADEWSDLDVVTICVDPEPYLESSTWVQDIAPYWLTFLEPTAVGDFTERRVLFEGGADADFSFISLVVMRHMISEGFPEDIQSVFRRGVRVLVDKEKMAGAIEAFNDAPAPSWRAPSEAEFQELVQDFLYHAVWTAKKLRRGEVWTAKSCLDGFMKWQLLSMIEWHTRAKHPMRRIWHNGRFLEEWADERALNELRTAFARYDANDVAPALKQTLYLFNWIAQEVANLWNYSFPPAHYKDVIAWVDETLDGK